MKKQRWVSAVLVMILSFSLFGTVKTFGKGITKAKTGNVIRLDNYDQDDLSERTGEYTETEEENVIEAEDEDVTLSKVSINKITVGTDSIHLFWKKVFGIDGYQIAYGNNKTMNNAKYANVKASATSKRFRALSRGKKYYFKIRAYKLIDGKKSYSGWSEIKSKLLLEQIDSRTCTLVCGLTAEIKSVAGKDYKYYSSNKKVATVGKKGRIKALKLGETTITVKKGKVKEDYYITVVPETENDLKISRDILLSGEKTQIKLTSERYDTSLINHRFDSIYGQLNEYGEWVGANDRGLDHIWFSYGSYQSKRYDVFLLSLEELCEELTWFSQASMDNHLLPGVEYENSIEFSTIFFENYCRLASSDLLRNGIHIEIDGEQIQDVSTFSVGVHTLRVYGESTSLEKEFRVTYDRLNTLKLHDATGYPSGQKEVLDAVFAAVESVITEGMTDREKVLAIHDYLVYHSDYYNNGDYSNAPRWAYAAKGVLVSREGVCESYSRAFCLMAVASGVDCKMVHGTAYNTLGINDHAWNKVFVDGTWYYIDCTWDDPVGGGYERYTYYLSENLWGDHYYESETSILDEARDWENLLTGYT